MVRPSFRAANTGLGFRIGGTAAFPRVPPAYAQRQAAGARGSCCGGRATIIFVRSVWRAACEIPRCTPHSLSAGVENLNPGSIEISSGYPSCWPVRSSSGMISSTVPKNPAEATGRRE